MVFKLSSQFGLISVGFNSNRLTKCEEDAARIFDGMHSSYSRLLLGTHATKQAVLETLDKIFLKMKGAFVYLSCHGFYPNFLQSANYNNDWWQLSDRLSPADLLRSLEPGKTLLIVSDSCSSLTSLRNQPLNQISGWALAPNPGEVIYDGKGLADEVLGLKPLSHYWFPYSTN